MFKVIFEKIARAIFSMMIEELSSWGEMLDKEIKSLSEQVLELSVKEELLGEVINSKLNDFEVRFRSIESSQSRGRE